MSLEEVTKSISELLEKFTASKVEIVPNTRLLHDLFIYGDDFSEICEILCEKYQLQYVDLDFNLYFPNETEWVRFSNWLNPQYMDKWLTLTVKDLAYLVTKPMGTEMTNQELFVEADNLYDRNEYELAFNLFMKGAKAGDTSCMSRIALMYCDGDGVDRDFDKSIEWDRKAYDAGYKTSLLNMAITYRMKGRMLNYKYWLEQSLADGTGSAALELAKLYMISDKEKDNVLKYLKITISHDGMTEAEIEEAEMLLSEMQ